MLITSLLHNPQNQNSLHRSNGPEMMIFLLIDVKKILESTDVSMQSESISTGQIVESVNNITTEITDMTNTSSKNSTQEYHTITEKLSHPGNTDSTVIEVSSKHQINNKLEEEKISEMSDSLFNASSSSTQTSSTAFVIETTIDSKSISDANPRMDNSENVGTSEHTTSDTFKIMSPSITTSLPLPEGSKGVTFNVIHTSTKNNAKFLMETTDSHTINLDSVTSSATIVPSLSSKALTMEEPILTEKLTSAEIDKSTRSTAGLSARNTATHSQISTIPAISQSHINDFAYSLEGFINASTSTTLDHSTHSRENSFSSGNEDEIGRTTIEPHQSTARTQANETELKGSTITESVRSAITSRAYSDTNMSNIPNILDATESGSSSRTQVHNRASTLEISRTIPEDASNNKSSAIISVPEVLKALIQEDKHPSPSDKNTEHFISGRTSSFFTTKFSTALGKTSPGNVIDLSGILTDTSLSSNDKELLMTTDEPLITDNLQQSTSNDLPSSTEASGIMKVTFSSLVANNLSKNSEFSTIAATDSSDDKLSNSFIIGKSHELISDSESADKPSAGSTAATISDEIIVASTFTVKLQKIFPNEIVFNSSQAIETSTTSTTSSMEDIIEISNATSEVTIEMKGIQNITTTLDDDIKFTTAATQIPMAVFNVTLPASQYDAYFLLHINRTSKNYNYLLLDEISYTNDMDSEAPDPSEIAVIMNDEINSLNNSGSDANETYTDFYADDSLSSVDDTVVEEKFRLANLALRNRYKMETATTSIPDGSMQTDAASNWVKNAEDQQHHHQFSTDGNSSSGHLAKNTIAVNTFENPTLSQNSEGLTKESDDTSSHHQENSTTESTQSTPLAQITNPIKIDFTFQGSRENFTVPIALHEVNSTALNGAENQSNTLPLNYISSTSVPEIEEIAAVNTNARKIVHQTLTVLEAEKSTGSDATLPVISTILWNSATSKPIIGLSSDQAFLKELSSTLAQPQIDESITESSTNNERSSTTETTDNIADTFRNSVTAIFFQQKRSIDKNDITPASTIILTGIQDDINISLVNRTTFNSTSTSVASFQDNLTRYSLTNGETLQPFSGTSKNSHLSYDKNIIDNFTKKETSQSFSGFSASGDISSDKSITDSRSSEFSSGISASNSFSSDTSIANDEERNTRT
uniref:EGF-like domain-containing protein n=1 Tax=Elaeophora elaphi TaxID=1147741 RepID=A0A0R3RPY9_9BILA